MIYWAGCSVAAAIAINKQIQGATRATPAVRKVFHIFAVAVYLPGLFYECTFIYLASGVVLGIFGMLEVNYIQSVLAGIIDVFFKPDVEDLKNSTLVRLPTKRL